MGIYWTLCRPALPLSPSSLQARTQAPDRQAADETSSRRQKPSILRWGWTGGTGLQRAIQRKGAELRLKLGSLWVSQKLQEYLSGRSILAKLQAKHEKLQEAIQQGGSYSGITSLGPKVSPPCPSDLAHAPP